MIRSPHRADWERFVSLTREEGWRVPQLEQQLFTGPWSGHAHVLDDQGFCGLVTAVVHEKSAWIGNLIVPRPLRGRGYGRHLFRTALNKLLAQNLSSIWLTASEQGRHLYASEGFVTVDRIDRWVLTPPWKAVQSPVQDEAPCRQLFRADASAWSENRQGLLSSLCNHGRVFAQGRSVALLQGESAMQIIGPWYAGGESPQDNGDLLQRMLAAADPDIELVIDLLASSATATMAESSGFRCVGQVALMAYGRIDDVNLNSMTALASLGSVG